MDARPCRPWGAENAIDHLHQRQKSAGTLATMLAAPVTGFRGQAKRAAFGDVTNLSKGLLSSAHDDHNKPAKPSAPAIAALHLLPPSHPPSSTTATSTTTTTTTAKSTTTATKTKGTATTNPAAAASATTTTTTTTAKPPSHMSAGQTKENAPFSSRDTHPITHTHTRAHGSLSRPAQRPSTLPTNKTKAALPENRQIQDAASRKPVTTSAGAQDTSANLCKFDFDIPTQQEPHQQHARSNAVSNRKMPVFQPPADAPPRQARHHKSQPQLKQQPQPQQQAQQQLQQQPPLRRTQSKPETADPQSESSSTADSTRTSIGSLAMTATGGEPPSDPAYLESLCISIDSESRVIASDKSSDDLIDLAIKLPEISEEPPSDISFKDYPALSFSEAEEAWDYDDDDDDDDEEEEEENDDDDYDEHEQAYTTTYSTKTRDLTTANVTCMLAPRVTARVQLELDNARLEVERTRPPEDIEEEAWDVSMVAEYGDEIFAYMRELEVRMSPNPDYMDIQSEIQWSMRSVLMDWVVQVHNRFNLLPETLFLTVNYIDRFLSCKVVSIGKLQLVGATAILVASKYEEINCPSLEEIVYMVDGGYTTEEVLKAERFMLSMLSFELGWPGPMSFLRRVSKADDYDLETRTLAKYFMELTIMDERFVASPPSFVAAGAHCLSRLILNKGYWTKHHVHYSGYTWSQLKSLVTMMIECCENPKQHHGAIFDKYKEKRFREASLLVQQAMDAGFALPHHPRPVRRPAAQPALLGGGLLDQPRTGVFLPV